ncbi:HAL/PAL/TAL family ammonia-lyase [Liquorilactobacillus hordei]|uniref:Histidine ammonia-lyase n=1 Tax=Liquorilactobacillus hordei TaxID=468911 RepID=A0A3Q8CEA5_9LACO|nr:aromatic amino acid ammonia-lyase [Liquorilactobacillus hordei]AUJ30510.1 hypothetical protein BSQ49_10150 [Liquorilactobacillus hordei]
MNFKAVLCGNPRKIKKVVLGGKEISITDFIAVTNYDAMVEFDDIYITRVTKAHNNLNEALLSSKKIYGVNTGLGDNWNKSVDLQIQNKLQKNILRSHAVAVGNPISYEETRAIMMMTLISLGRGFSGVSIETLESIQKMLNAKLYPFAPGEGSVGYLSIEAHIYRVMIGEGKVFENHQLVDCKEVLAEKGLKIPTLKSKEGLALISGTMSVTAIALLAIYSIYEDLKNIQIGSVMSIEGLKGSLNEFSDNVMNLKKHSEQAEAAINIKRMLAGSKNLEKNSDLRVQDALSIRTLPQMIGALNRVFKETLRSVYEEMMSVSDNPILMEEKGQTQVYMNGNFDASYVSLHMDYLVIAVTNFVNTIERITNRFLDTKLSGFPPFLVNLPGINNGLMIVHYTMAGLLNEMKLLANPVNINNSSMSAEQEDVVTFAFLSSKKALTVSKKFKEIIAIWFFVCKEGLGFIESNELSPTIKKMVSVMEQTVPSVVEDRPFYDDLVKIKKLLNQGTLINEIEEHIGEIKIDLNI